MVLQATSAGFVPACDMSAKSQYRGCPGCQDEVARAPSCHAAAATQSLPRKACCFFSVLNPCADGAVAKAQLTAPAPTAVPFALAVATPGWASLPTVTTSVAVPPGIADLATGPPRTIVLLI
jgi:hypothetical protein